MSERIISEQENDVISRLRKEREKARLSQFELAMKAGVSQTMINYIENGERTPTLTTLLKICNALEINPSIIFEKESSERLKDKDTIMKIINKYM